MSQCLSPHPTCYLSPNPFQFVNAFPDMKTLMLLMSLMHNNMTEWWGIAMLCWTLVNPGTSHMRQP